MIYKQKRPARHTAEGRFMPILRLRAANPAVSLVGGYFVNRGQSDKYVNDLFDCRHAAENRANEVVSERVKKPVQSANHKKNEGNNVKIFHRLI